MTKMPLPKGQLYNFKYDIEYDDTNLFTDIGFDETSEKNHTYKLLVKNSD